MRTMVRPYESLSFRSHSKMLWGTRSSEYPVNMKSSVRYHLKNILDMIERSMPDKPTDHELPPLTVSFQTNESSLFQRLVHPEGACYYVYYNKRYYTDADITDDLTKDRVLSCINDFEDFIRARSIQLSERANVVFSINDDDPAKYICDYYVADHTTRSVFWLDTFNASWLPYWSETKGVSSLAHIEHAVVAQYWYHCHLFPHSYELTVEAVDELRDILSHCIADTITSATSTVPYNVTDLNEMLLLMNNLRKNPSTGGGVSAYSRIMHIFASQRFINFHGQPGVRLDRDCSIHYPSSKVHNRPWLMRCLSPALFSAPDLYYQSLTKLYVDGLVHEASWADFVVKMNAEWDQLILFNTVLLNANVAFLAIQSIDNASTNPGRSPPQIASFLSIVASFGSIILGLVLARKHRAKAKDTAYDAAKFLNSWMRHRLGLATLAILYSVPYALLMWGVLGFLIAFSFMCYSSSDVMVISLMSGAWFVVAILVLWCVTALASWDQRLDEPKSFWELVHSCLSFILFGLWWLAEEIVETLVRGFKLMPILIKKN
ncbi:hypothetical protein BT96DRAFT_55301 [Gymnopus androsaceus JB14]|uniref:Uncharacterized protein n=1 Tax=Gymnopus androsaceus JB14 TaxID=1447944 RepID=A0A6A4IDX7_9AGAR|nr:hypothetical protein BT96DRAFT_55301 [Gymnopus androsaceus JB14]